MNVNRNFILLICLCCFTNFFIFCNEKVATTSHESDTFKKDIPLDKRGRPKLFYESIRAAEEKMGLTLIEDGFDSLQVRIWYAYAFKDKAQVVIFKRTDRKWIAELITFKYNFNEKGDSVTSIKQDIKYGNPVSGWNDFTNEISTLGITSLPDKSHIESYPDFADGDDIIIEVATKKYYRIYSYKEPNKVQFKIQEAKQIEQILKLIEREFDFKRLRKL